MSFTNQVKSELLNLPSDGCCLPAELSAVFMSAGTLSITRGGVQAQIRTENRELLEYCANAVQKFSGTAAEVYASKRPGKNTRDMFVLRTAKQATLQLLRELGVVYTDAKGLLQLAGQPDRYIIEQDCCAKAFLRGMFLACGNITIPSDNQQLSSTGYHLSLFLQSQKLARAAGELMARFDILPKTIARQNGFLVYLKESQMICDFLALIGSSLAVLKLQTIIVERDVKNQTNRQTNCIIANLDKTAAAAVKQAEAINLIEKTIGLERLPEKLRKIARLRQEYPDVSLEQIAELSGEELTKSGINHRMRKIMSIAENL